MPQGELDHLTNLTHRLAELAETQTSGVGGGVNLNPKPFTLNPKHKTPNIPIPKQRALDSLSPKP